MSTIDDLKNKVARLSDELKTAKEKLIAAQIAASPAQIGTIWTRTVRGKKERGQVVRYGVRYHPGTPVLRLFKADGTLGLREGEISEWTNWKPE